MAIPSTYFVSTKNLEAILDQVRKGRVPPKFTYEHLKQLGFPSSADRPIIPVMKALGFLDASGVPLERYRRFKDQSQSKRVMAEGMREAYTDVFAIDESANKLPVDKLKGIFARLSDKGESVTDKMAMTFRALAEHADFSPAPPAEDESPSGGDGDGNGNEGDGGWKDQDRDQGGVLSLRHDVHIHLPISDDIKVYDAIFKSLREYILR